MKCVLCGGQSDQFVCEECISPARNLAKELISHPIYIPRTPRKRRPRSKTQGKLKNI